MTTGATNPERVWDKVRECRFFLIQMAEHEKAKETDKFLYCLSAFLSAFRTIAFRLYGVVQRRFDGAAKHALKNRLHSHAEISFLIERTNVELHEDGVLVFERFTVHGVDHFPRETGRFSGRFRARFGPRLGIVIHPAEGWQFAENPMNLVELCRDGLEAMESATREVMTEPSATRGAGEG